MPLSSCDDDRLGISREAELKLKEAREQSAAGNFEKALECYLFAFDNGRYVSGWGGVRLSYIPSEIVQLGTKYPLARKAMIQRRNAREALIIDGTIDYDVLAEWTSINMYLGESKRELSIMDLLKRTGKLKDGVAKTIIKSNLTYLLKRKQYDILGQILNEFGRSFLHEVFHYENELLFPKFLNRAEGGSQFREFSLNSIRKSGAQVFEIALGVKKQALAEEIARRILIHCEPVEAYCCLIASASRTNSNSTAILLREQASRELPEEKFSALCESLKELG